MDEKRKLFNQAILSRLKFLVNKYPDMRFGQLLINCDILQFNKKNNPEEKLTIKDCFNDESENIWERMCQSRFVFSEQYN